MSRRLSLSLIFVLALLVVSLSYLCLPCEAARGKELRFSFQVNQKEKVTPSYCMAVWLESPEGNYVKTLFASDWLAYGGYSVEGVCPLWVEQSNWVENDLELPDAISGATPAVGPKNLSFEWKKKVLPPGPYRYRIEVHISADYNEIYSGEIELGNGSCVSNAQVGYEPEMHPEASNLLSDVMVIFE